MEAVEMIDIYSLKANAVSMDTMPSIAKPLIPKPKFHPWDTRVYETKNVLLLSFTQYDQYSFSISHKKGEDRDFQQTPIKKFRQIKLTAYNGKLIVRYGQYSNTLASGADYESMNFQMMYPGRIASWLPLHAVDTINNFLDKHFSAVTEEVILDVSEESDIEEMRFVESYALEDKLTIGCLIKRLHGLSFPIMGQKIYNCVTDGFYSFRVGDSSGYIAYHHALTYQEMIKRLFGVYRKDLVKATLDCGMDALNWAENFVGILGIDAMVNVLTEYKGSRTNHSMNMHALKVFSDATLQRLMIDGMDNEIDIDVIEEALALASWIPSHKRRKCGSWATLHKMSNMYAGERYNGVETAYPSDWEAFFAGYSLDSSSLDAGYYVKPLRNRDDFLRVAEEMSNCVASLSYIQDSYEGIGYCFQVFDANDAEKGCVALVQVLKSKNGRWKVEQVKGVRNETVASLIVEKIYVMLEKHIDIFKYQQ